MGNEATFGRAGRPKRPLSPTVKALVITRVVLYFPVHVARTFGQHDRPIDAADG